MPTTAKVLIPAKLLENTQTTQYTAVLCTTKIDKCTVTNTSAANVSFSCNLVASGGAPGTANLIVKAQTIAPGEAYPCPELVGHTLMPGDMISTLASTASVLTILCGGRELT